MLDGSTLAFLEAVPGRIVVAYSGGCDSHVLLHLLHHQLNHPVEALHINHGIQADADTWQLHCESVCDQLGIPFTAFRVKLKSTGSVEANARAARYEVFDSELQPGDLLVLGHHRDDQVETILLNMLSGRAPLGVQGMPVQRALGRGQLFRPLLQASRNTLRQYAADQGLQWVEDASNQDTGHDRNYLRQEVIPKLAERWPSVSQTLMEQWARTSQMLDDQALAAKTDLESMSISFDCIESQKFSALSEARATGLLRYWLGSLNIDRMPPGDTLRKASQVLCAETSKSPMFELGDICLQRFRSRIVLLEKPRSISLDLLTTSSEGKSSEGKYSGITDLDLISADVVKGQGVTLPMGQLSFRTRRSGDKLLINGHHRSLKNLFQEAGYPPLVRERVPLIFDGDQMLGICGIRAWGIGMITGDLARADADAHGSDISWSPRSDN